MKAKPMTLPGMIDIGNEVVNSIDESRLENNQVLKNKVEIFKRLRQLGLSISKKKIRQRYRGRIIETISRSY